MLWPQTSCLHDSKEENIQKTICGYVQLCVAMPGGCVDVWMCGAQRVAIGGYVLLYVAKCR